MIFNSRQLFRKNNETQCRVCGKNSKIIAGCLELCSECIRERSDEALPYVKEVQTKIRASYGLPSQPPKTLNGIQCNVCANECRLGVGEISYCGLKQNKNEKLESLTNPDTGILYAYLDPQVTNCCSAWFCPSGTGAGYPQYVYRNGPEYGYYNLAIFCYACNFSCLFCQNVSHKNILEGTRTMTKELVERTRKNTFISCWCFFGGSPEPQLPFAIRASEIALKEMANRILRVCFEWNGCGHPKLVSQAAELSLKSGGNIKFDLKCFNNAMSIALSGVPNKRAYENFEMIAKEYYHRRPEMPLLTATTLLVPGYVDAIEVESISEFIADLSPEIPYSLLIFHPDHMMTDLPTTSLEQAIECYKAAKKHLTRVHIGNLNLLGLRSMKQFEAKIS